MKKVLDASVGFKWVVVEPLTDKARQLRDDFRKGIIELLAPDVFTVEIAHALARAERRGLLKPPQGTALLIDILNNRPQLFPILPDLLPRAFAKETGVPPRRINEIVHGARSISANTALRLARYFGTSEHFWMNLQARYDLEVEKDRLGARLQREVKPATATFPAPSSPQP